MNPGESFEGSLTREPMTVNESYTADYWSKRAIVYRMGNKLSTIYICMSIYHIFLSNIGPDEYFYKTDNHRNIDHPQHTSNNNPLSTTNTNNQEVKRHGGDVAASSIDIFDALAQRAQHKHLK